MRFDISGGVQVASGKHLGVIFSAAAEDQRTVDVLKEAIARDGIAPHVTELKQLRHCAPTLFAELNLPPDHPAMEQITEHPVTGASGLSADLLPRGGSIEQGKFGGREERC